MKHVLEKMMHRKQRKSIVRFKKFFDEWLDAHLHRIHV